MMKWAFFATLFLVVHWTSAQLPDGFVRQEIATGLNPTKMALAPNGRIFLAEKHGDVRIIENDHLLPDPFLSIEVDNNNERGMNGITLDPDFESNHFVYVFYTVVGQLFNRVSRFTANGNLAIPGSEVVIFELDRLGADVHNGGDLHFGLDGKLYISAGDGGVGGNAPNRGNVLGSILRINSDGTIPADNPFYNELEGRSRAIWAHGFRNPFGTVIHPITGDYYANDVGNDKFEEVNHVVSGGFYGWNNATGFNSPEGLPPNYKDPIHVYNHNQGCAVTGAAIYLPEKVHFPEEYTGIYFFMDYCEGEIRMLDLETKEYKGVFFKGAKRPIYMLVHPDGYLYYVERRGVADGSPWDNTETKEGVLWKIMYTGDGSPFIASQPKAAFVVQGEAASFEIEALGEGQLEYQWYEEELELPGETESILTIEPASFAQNGYNFRCRVSNQLGALLSENAVLTVTQNNRPMPVITNPKENQMYRAGTTIEFAGQASDPEDGMLPNENLAWRVDFHHNEHTHPAVSTMYDISSGSFEIPSIGEIDTNVWYRVYLTAHDSEDLSASTFIDLLPEKTEIRVTSDPIGLDINQDGKRTQTPFSFKSVKGIQRTVKAPLKQLRGDSLYFFRNWENQENQQFVTFLADEPQTLHANFEGVRIGNGDGLTASYYDNVDLEGSPVATAQDSAIDYLFHIGAPIPELPKDFWSVRWEGFILPYQTGRHIFTLHVDDGIRLWVDNQELMNDWSGGSKFKQASINLEGGRLYPVRMEMFEHSWGSFISFRWSADYFPEEIIPKSQMYSKSFIDPTAKENLFIFPNPVVDKLALRMTSLVRRSLHFRLFDNLGRIALEQSFFVDFGENEAEMDVNHLVPGGYFLKVTDLSGQTFWESKVIIQ